MKKEEVGVDGELEMGEELMEGELMRGWSGEMVGEEEVRGECGEKGEEEGADREVFWTICGLWLKKGHWTWRENDWK